MTGSIPDADLRAALGPLPREPKRVTAKDCPQCGHAMSPVPDARRQTFACPCGVRLERHPVDGQMQGRAGVFDVPCWVETRVKR